MPRTETPSGVMRLTVVGPGRLGTAIVAALSADSRFSLSGPFGRGDQGRSSQLSRGDVVLLCVPDREIAAAAAVLPPGVIAGHCSGATGLEPLAPHESFSLHPLMTVSPTGADFAGASAAIDGGSPRALEVAARIARALGMTTVRVRPEDRAAYHAAAAIASNFLVTLEAAAERLGTSAGVSREMLVPLVRATVENWAAAGAERALTGPVARGDELTVERHREAVAERAPELSPLFDAMVDATRALATAAPLPVATAAPLPATPSRQLEHA